MEAIRPRLEVYVDKPEMEIYKSLEFYGRTCYKSEAKISADSTLAFVRKIMSNGHESVIEHEKVTVRVIMDRGVSHEWVRHRIGSYSQESTRYCNYKGMIEFILPLFFEEYPERLAEWKVAMLDAERHYTNLINMGAKPEEARSVLPNSLKTELVVTFNLREWRYFFKLRTSPRAHPQMREVAIPLLLEFNRYLPEIFNDLRTKLPEHSELLYPEIEVWQAG